MKTIKQKWRHALGIIKQTVHHLSNWQRAMFVFLCVLVIVGVFGIIAQLIRTTTTVVPTSGGTFTEGVVGTPRFINPVLATSEPDKDLVEIVYAGLVMRDDNDYLPELAQEYSISDDGTVYTFILNEHAQFHDGTPVTAHDVVFTVELAQNSAVKSPLRPEWLGVAALAIDEKTVQFVLESPYAGFLDVTTLGIMPQHIWNNVPADQLGFSDFNIQAIGAGPYTIYDVDKNRLGLLEKITLKRNKKYILGKPFLKKFEFLFFTDIEQQQKALHRRNIDGAYNIPTPALQDINSRAFTINTTPRPHVFALFFNQNTQSIFLENTVLQAIDTALPKEAIIKRIMHGYGTPLCGPFPPHTLGFNACDEDILRMTGQERIDVANQILENNNWKRNSEGLREKSGTVLEFTLALPNNPELKETAAMIETTLSDLGINVIQQVFEPGNFDQDVIRPRAYQALLFGQFYEHDTDSFAFWHSNGRIDPGLNVGLYTNSEADELLRTALVTENHNERRLIYDELHTVFSENIPATFLYTPDFIYITRSHIHNIETSPIINSHDRLRMVHTWYRHTNRIW